MTHLAFLFEVSDKIPSVEMLYLSGVFFAVIVFIAAFINRWLGLALLLAALWISTQTMSNRLGADIIDDIRREMSNNYEKHWNYSMIFSALLETFAFITGLFIKNYFKKRSQKLNLD